jgi:hypothetical protein
MLHTECLYFMSKLLFTEVKLIILILKIFETKLNYDLVQINGFKF